MSAAKVAVAEKRVKSCRSPTSGQRRYSPTGRRSPTAALNGHAESPPHKTNGLLVDRQPAAPPVPAVNGFPVTRDAPAATRPSRVADNGHSPTAAVQQRKAASAKGHHPPHHKATQLKSSSQPAANQRSAQQHNNNNNNKVQHPAKQRNGGGPTGVEDMVVVSALRRQQMKDAFQPWVMQVDALFMSPLPPPPLLARSCWCKGRRRASHSLCRIVANPICSGTHIDRPLWGSGGTSRPGAGGGVAGAAGVHVAAPSAAASAMQRTSRVRLSRSLPRVNQATASSNNLSRRLLMTH